MPIDADGNYTGTLFTLLNPYGLLGGLATVALFCCYGAIFVALKTVGTIREDARSLAGRIGIVAVLLGAIFLLWTLLAHGNGLSVVFAVLTAVALIVGLLANAQEYEGWAFGFFGAGIVGRRGDPVRRAVPGRHALEHQPGVQPHHRQRELHGLHPAVMSWVALGTLPFVLAYQAWTYWVFRKRVGRGSIPTTPQHGAARVLP